MMRSKTHLAFLAGFAIMFSSPAGIITLDRDTHLSTAENSSGTYTKTKGAGKGNDTFTHSSTIATVSKTGKPKKGDSTPQSESRAYFVFDLSAVTATILTASIDFTGAGDDLNFEFYKVTSDVDALRTGAGNNAALKTFYDDLGGGKKDKYAKGKGTTFDFAAALNDLNTARGSASALFAFGVKSKDQKSFAFDNLKLTLTTAVPEPGEILLLLAGICLVFAMRRKKLAMA